MEQCKGERESERESEMATKTIVVYTAETKVVNKRYRISVWQHSATLDNELRSFLFIFSLVVELSQRIFFRIGIQSETNDWVKYALS